MNTLQIGSKVKYANQVATIVAHAPECCGQPCVILEYPAIFHDFGKDYAQTSHLTIIEAGLELVD